MIACDCAHHHTRNQKFSSGKGGSTTPRSELNCLVSGIWCKILQPSQLWALFLHYRQSCFQTLIKFSLICEFNSTYWFSRGSTPPLPPDTGMN